MWFLRKWQSLHPGLFQHLNLAFFDKLYLCISFDLLLFFLQKKCKTSATTLLQPKKVKAQSPLWRVIILKSEGEEEEEEDVGLDVPLP